MNLFSILWLFGWLAFLIGVASPFTGFLRGHRLVLIIGGLLLGLATQGVYVVEAGYVGVRKTMGKVNAQELTPGLHWVVPLFETVVTMETRLKSFPVDSPSSSKDLQAVRAVVSVQHCLNGKRSADAYQSVGDLSKFDANVVAPAVHEAMKAVTAHHTAAELITNREEVKLAIVLAIQANIDKTLSDKQLQGALVIANVSIQDFEFSSEFNKSIEAKVRSAQEALQAENEKLRRTTLAEADKREKELSGEAEAYAIDVKSKAHAAAIEREGKALAQASPSLIKLRFIQAWDGNLPVFSGGQTVPFVNIENMERPSQPAPESQPHK